MFRRTAFALLLSATTFTLAAHAAMSGGGPLKISGKAVGLSFTGTAKFSVSENEGKLVFVTNLRDSLDMGVRDDHTKRSFKVKEFPKATLTIDKSKLKLPEKGESSGSVTGHLTLAKGAKDVNVNYTVAKEGDGYRIKNASFTFDYTKFGVEEICKVICVKPEVNVSVSDVKING
ncbi:MAG TPA: YceI family protein [Polyangiaceae bacterium]|nr:YceI family protein [Polyangiaceae bacterium]